MLKQILKFISGIIVIALAIYGGIYAWFQIKAVEDIHQTDIYEAVPANPSMMLIVHKPELLPEVWNVCCKFSNFLPEEKSLTVVNAIAKSQICSEQCIDKEPLAISYYPEGTLLFSRMKLKDFEYLEKKFFKANLSGFAPKKEVYKEAEINIKATNDESFFCYTLYHNIFIGSFEKKLIYKAIDAYARQSCLKNDSTFKETIVSFDKFDKNSLAGLYLNEPQKYLIFRELNSDTLNRWLTGDIKFKDQILEISGFVPANEQDTLSVDSISSSSPCMEDSVKYENDIIRLRNKETVEDYLTSVKEENAFDQNPVFQAVFNDHYDNDVHEIIWIRKEFAWEEKPVFYNFLLFVSPNHTDKFYSLSIVREP